MRYVLLLANAPDAWDDTAARAAQGVDDGVIDDWAAYTRALHEAGVLVAGHALHSPSAATSVRVRNGRRLLTDGPFADTEEHLLGYYVIEVADLDDALSWAARVPNARTGVIEVRPITDGSSTEEVLATGTSPGSG